MSRPPDRHPGYENEQRSTTYKIRVICNNCGSFYRIEIPKGITVEDFLPLQECSNCCCSDTFRKV